ncbi:protein TOPLESS-like isoform X1 [Camellia sinensis]|uniref:protein TOPLESS-like isoform X1 n=1 Tax=Camellia sinensis TaxID=4442 RepID=UPI00103578C2|nr:protein TOPLESS-like isoform X1 [Camellia sinensis]
MSLSKELILLILQFCHEEDLKKTAHMLEHETGVFFDMEYFEDMVLFGNWDEAEKYLSGFTRLEDDKYSRKIYFEIRKQKFLEALDEHDRARALDILVKELKVFAISNEELYKEMTQLLTFDDFRKHGSLSMYGDVLSARKCMMNDIKNIIDADPLFQDKLKFPHINKSRLRRLINQSLNWQHILCSYPQPDPDIQTLFMDHQCPLPDHFSSQSVENDLLPSQDTAASPSRSSCKGTSSVTQSAIPDGPLSLGAPTNSGSGFNSGAEVSVCSSETKSFRTSDEWVSARIVPGQPHSPVFNNHDDLPKTVQRVLTEASSPTSIDFHPVQQNLLLVGTNDGDIGLWEVSSGEKLLSRKFHVWKIRNISKTFVVALLKDPHVSVNHISWSLDGLLFGVAYSKHIVHLYSYHGDSKIQKRLEIDAHVGGVNDLAFSEPNKVLFLITCGNDKLIQVWDVNTGAKQFTFEGHGDPVYSVCAHVKERIHFIFSTSANGEMKAWLYDNMGPRVAFDAPGHCCTRMAYSTDGKRLFSCGTTKDGESFILEWNETEGYVKRSYQGLGKCSSGVVHFDTSKNRFLVAGDDHLIKVWDIDHAELVTVIDADGDLPARPHVRFNKSGRLMAVTANHNNIKILANPFGHELLQSSENGSIDASTVLSETLERLVINPISTASSSSATEGGVSGMGSPGKNGDAGNSKDIKPELPAESNEILEVSKSEINEPSQCQSLRLPSEVKIEKISRLIYTNAGNSIVALASNGIHLLWKWSRNETNLSGKATTKFPPQLWQPKSGLLMTNDLTGVTFEEFLPCFALSKNDSYVVSASKGMISLFNMMTFKKITAFMPPPPAATCIAFYPQDNNIIAIGLDDSTVLIYHVRSDEVIDKLNGHSKRVTGLAFSSTLNVLVSSGADAQIVVWNTNGWEKKKSKMLRIPVREFPSAPSNTYVQFHQDQKHFLSIHETRLAIYETTELECVKQCVIGEFYARISHATFSCDSQLVYASFVDGTVLIYDASDFHIRCEVNPAAYLPSDISSKVYPVTIAAHPQEPNQFALGLTNGSVVVIEPLESTGKWVAVSSVSQLTYRF